MGPFLFFREICMSFYGNMAQTYSKEDVTWMKKFVTF